MISGARSVSCRVLDSDTVIDDFCRLIWCKNCVGKMAEEKDVKEVVEEKNDNSPMRKEKKGIFSRFWNGLIRLHGDDFEKRLQYISKEEATILARMKKRYTRWRKTARNIIVSSLFLEVILISFGN